MTKTDPKNLFVPMKAREVDWIDPNAVLGTKEEAFVALHKPKIAMALSDLRKALERLGLALQDAKLAVVFEPIYEMVEVKKGKEVVQESKLTGYKRLGHEAALEAAITAYCTLELKPDDLVNTPVKCHGAIGVKDPRIITIAEEVNRLKDVVKAAFKATTNRRVNVTINSGKSKVIKKIPVALFILRQLQQSSLNRLGAYRAIPLIRTGKEQGAHPATPLQMSFTAAWTGSYLKTTLKELRVEAEIKGWIEMKNRLRKIEFDENEFIYNKPERYLRMRANLWFPGATPEDRRPKNYMGEMPILFLMPKDNATPPIIGPNPRENDAPEKRPKFKLEEEPIYEGSKYYRRKDQTKREFRQNHLE